MSRSETEIQIQKLKESIQTGKMTTEEFKDRLRQIIDTELLKDDEEVDIDLIKACESYFTHLHGKEEPLSEEERQRLWAKIQDRIKTKETKKRTFRKAPVYAVIAVVAIIILFFGISIRFQWFLPSSTPDGQQYVITGKQISIETISKAIAEHQMYDSIVTEDETELYVFLGFELEGIIPILPKWSVEYYQAMFLPDTIMLYVVFNNQEDDLLRYTVRWVTDYDQLYYSIEQKDEGKTLVINDTRVYRSVNYNDISYTWVKDSTIFLLCGNSADELIMSFLGERLNET